VENIPKTRTDFLPMKISYVLLFMKRFAGRKLAGNSPEQLESPGRLFQEIVPGTRTILWDNLCMTKSGQSADRPSISVGLFQPNKESGLVFFGFLEMYCKLAGTAENISSGA